MKDFLKIMKALSDSNRLRIIAMLKERELCVCEITDVLQLATSTVSKHLSILKEADIITDEKDGKWVNYKIADNMSELVHDALKLFELHKGNDIQLLNDKMKLSVTDRNIICAN
jgi:ArsR family transcriptional regulator